ncbi:YceI family protein [Streptoalloteichus hindustanus]|uniref:Polyisoprenoid-binding protein YceI n=1 Tax=Streptoalloteichus hindustanus TaxID=2017 RepID=A0A1M5EZG6_STRHI|nr:YceI family protein [Streptoalloteichus hindustanus]SHF84402.1 Polyisoprenoid-binding protein YceI [Streptoalloteichus hindustanus]
MTTARDLTPFTGTYTIDPSHSQIGFVARHAMVTKVRGAFNDFAGTAVFDAANPEATAVTVTIQAASIDTRNAQRDEHLRGNDFFDMSTYPEITFVSTALRVTGDDTFDLVGDLTVKGVTREVTVPFTYQGAATDPFGNQRLGFEGSVVINRKDYGVTWNAALETGGVLVSDKITLEFEISAIRNA